MADNIKLQVDLEPQIKNLQELEKQMTDAVKKIGDQKVATKLTADLQNIRNQITSIQNIVNSPKGFDASIVNRNIGSVLKSIRNLGEELTEAFGGPSSDAVKKLETQIAKMDDELKKSQARLAQYKQVLGKTAGGEVGLKEGYYKSKLREADLHGFNQDTTIRKTAIASEEQLYKVKTGLENRKDLTPEMQKMIDAMNRFIAEMEKTKQENIKGYNQEVQNQQNLQLQRDTLVQQRETEIEHMKTDAVDSSKLTADQAEVAKLNVDVLTAQTTNEAVAKSMRGGKGPSGTNTDLETVDKIAGVDNATKNLNRSTGTLSGTVGKAVKNFTSYTIVLGTLRRVVRSAIQTVKQLDKALTEQAMVSGKTRQQTYALLKSYQNIAMQSGATTKEVAGVATQYFRQGKTAKDALTLTEAAVKAAKVASISTAESVDYLTTAINGFKLSAEDAMAVSDRFSALAARSATSYEELAIALSKVASQANLAGMSMDYTLGLLAKGIETTREAPETIGTALKTVIARMRELKDYGETLEGDSTVNNVEQQLKYIGIALRNQAGELRSTEDVLDELGRKWDTLSSNQQAAIAKALAGTRQQSRLISMMQDYERTMELVQISERSAGATAAQADTYMQGMEASLNKITVSWEKFITAFTQDGSFIVELLNKFGDSLNTLAEYGSTLEGQIVIYSILATAILGIVTAKALHNRATIVGIAQEKQAIAVKQHEILIDAIQKLKILENAKAQLKDAKATDILTEQVWQLVKAKAALVKDTVAERKATAELTAEEFDNLELSEQEAVLNAAIAAQKKEVATATVNYAKAQADANLTSKTGISTLLSMVPVLGSVISGIITFTATTKIASKTVKTEAKDLQVEGYKTQAAWWWVTIIVGVIAALIAGIYVLVKWLESTRVTAEKVTKSIRALNTEVIHVQQASDSIKTAIAKYEALDNKVIQTKEDIEDLNAALASVEDLLSEEQKKQYQLMSPSQKIAYLKQLEAVKEAEIVALRAQSLNLLTKYKELTGELLQDESNRAVVTDTINNGFYQQIDKLVEIGKVTQEEASDLEDFIKSFTGDIEANTALGLIDFTDDLQEDFTFKQDAINYFKNNGLTITNELAKQIKDNGLSSVLPDLESYFASTGQLEKFHTLLSEKTSASLNEIFAQTNTEILVNTRTAQGNLISTVLRDGQAETLEALDAYGTFITSNIDQAIKTAVLRTSEGQSLTQVQSFFDSIHGNLKSEIGKLKIPINDFFEFINNFAKTGLTNQEISDVLSGIINHETVEQLETYITSAEVDLEQFKTYVVNTFSSLGGDMIQWVQKYQEFGNNIKNIYEKIAKWHELSKEEQRQFIDENPELMDIPGIMDAINSGDDISPFIKQVYEEERQRLLQEIDYDIESAIAEGKLEKAKYLQQLKRELENEQALYSDSLENIQKKQDTLLNYYKSYLEKENEATIKALEKRRDAYEEYFEAINRAYEDQDWMEQQNLLITNITKLSGSTDATSLNKMASLQQQLQENMKERQKELRERAQEALVNNIDKQIDETNELLDSILANVQGMWEDLTSAEGSKIVQNMLNQMKNDTGFTAEGRELNAAGLIQAAAQNGIGTLTATPEIDNNSVTTINNLNFPGLTYQISNEDKDVIMDKTHINDALNQNGQSPV